MADPTSYPVWLTPPSPEMPTGVAYSADDYAVALEQGYTYQATVPVTHVQDWSDSTSDVVSGVFSSEIPVNVEQPLAAME